MSKAFTSEETPEAAPVTRVPPRPSPGSARYVTPEGQAELRAQAARLREERERVLAGDAPGRDGAAAELERRAALLEGTLAALTVLGPDAAPQGRAAFGTWVTVEDEAGRRTTWRIVGPDEADVRSGRISADSPVARALLGRGAGDEVLVRRPGGDATLTVVEVRRSAP